MFPPKYIYIRTKTEPHIERLVVEESLSEDLKSNGHKQ